MILYGNEVGTVLEKVITFLPKFEIYKNNEYIGCLSKELSSLLHIIILTTTDGILMELLLNGTIQLWMKAMIF